MASDQGSIFGPRILGLGFRAKGLGLRVLKLFRARFGGFDFQVSFWLRSGLDRRV